MMLRNYSFNFYILLIAIIFLGQDILVLPFNGISISEPFFLISFIFVLFSKKSLDLCDFIFLFIIFLYFLGSLFFSSIFDGGVQYQLKNYAFFFMLYYTAKNSTFTDAGFNLIISSIVFSILFIILCSLINGFSYGLTQFATDRGVDIFPGMKWNGLVAIISLIFPVILFCNLNKIKLPYISSPLVLFFLLFVVVLSGGRQALLTILLTSFIQIFILKNSVSAKSKSFILFACVLFYLISDIFTKMYFQDFHDFSKVKMDNVLIDLYEVRFLQGFIYPLLEFDLLGNFFIGDPISNKHNIFSTVLYKIGFVGTLIFFFHYFYIFIKIYNLSRFYAFLTLVVFISFFVTNMIANIWYQVFQYGYFFWLIIGAIQSRSMSSN